MFDPRKINLTAPAAQPTSVLEARSGYEEIDSKTPLKHKEAIIREEYARTYSWLTSYPKEGRCYEPRFMGYHYNMTLHADYAWSCLKAEGISMLPLFPFFHYFLDFADPFRKITILVEEEETPWDEQAVVEQDKLLSLTGWTVYRIPKKVAHTFETKLLPEEMGRCPYGEFDDDEQYQTYLSYKPRLREETIDGFFSWLKEEVYSKR